MPNEQRADIKRLGDTIAGRLAGMVCVMARQQAPLLGAAAARDLVAGIAAYQLVLLAGETAQD